jgi:hypothetical protein
LKSLESNTVTFVVTIWVDTETNNGDGAGCAWRGEIREVMHEQQTRKSFETLQDIVEHVRPYLEARGVRFD